MKDYIKNELACLRAMEPIGGVRYKELTKAIKWVDCQKESGNEEPKTEPQKGEYAHTIIMWKDDCKKEKVVISLRPYDSEIHGKVDDGIFYYCENEEEYQKLCDWDNGEDFVVVGCTLFTKTL